MTVLNLSKLTTLANLTFNDFLAAHRTGNNQAVFYYKELALQGAAASQTNTQNDASHALAVVQNQTIAGMYENAYAKQMASYSSVDLTYGSDAWLKVKYDKMETDLSLRTRSVNVNGGSGELNYSDDIAITLASVQNVGLTPDISPTYIPLSTLAKSDPATAQALYTNYLQSGTGLAGVINASLKLGFGAKVSSQQDIPDMLQDWVSQAKWITNSINALEEVGRNLSNTNDISALT
jgi:hypothetical protein